MNHLAKQRGDLDSGRLLGACSQGSFHEACVAETKLAAWFVGQIGQLYAVEKKTPGAKGWTGIYGRRCGRGNRQPVLDRLHRAMELIRRKTLPQGLLGQAIDYTLKRWKALNQFITDGTLEIDNNGIENFDSPKRALGKTQLAVHWASRSLSRRTPALPLFTHCSVIVGGTEPIRLII